MVELIGGKQVMIEKFSGVHDDRVISDNRVMLK